MRVQRGRRLGSVRLLAGGPLLLVVEQSQLAQVDGRQIGGLALVGQRQLLVVGSCRRVAPAGVSKCLVAGERLVDVLRLLVLLLLLLLVGEKLGRQLECRLEIAQRRRPVPAGRR